MVEDDARAMLEALIRDRHEDYAGLSRMLGRNPAYIQQYVKRGTPRLLAERDRRLLARYFDVPEEALGGPASAAPAARDLVTVPRIDVRASAGPGAIAGEERARAGMTFPPELLRELGVGRTAALSMIRVAGESMAPTLRDGDDILIDRDDAAARLRDGIYVLRVGDALIVKRVALRAGGGVAVLSDNPASPDWPDTDRAALTVIGRVIWAGRRLR